MTAMTPSPRRRTPVDVTVEVVVHRPLAAVAEYLFDPTTRARWRSDVAAVRREHAEGPGSGLVAGTRFASILDGRGGLRVDRVEEHVPLERLTVATVSGGPPLVEELTVRPEGHGSTVVTLRTTGSSGRSGIAGRVADGRLGRSVRRARDTDLARLKTILELDRG